MKRSDPLLIRMIHKYVEKISHRVYNTYSILIDFKCTFPFNLRGTHILELDFYGSVFGMRVYPAVFQIRDILI
jgi:hypothetical protein